MSEQFIGGWLWDEEDKQYLARLSPEDEVLQLVGQYVELTVDPRQALRVENQGPQGACQGHAISSVCEWCYILETGDTALQLSRAFGYYESQRLDNIRGDRGSTISAGVKLAINTGIPEERLWAYPSRGYDNTRPANWSEVIANAARYRIRSSYAITSYDGLRAFLGSGQGAVSIGIRWGSGMSKAVLERFAPGNGGHAIGLFALSERVDASGRPYVWMMNSWGTQFGNNGWSEWSPTAISEMLGSTYTKAVGLSEMPEVRPREWDVEQWKQRLRAA